MLIQLEEKQLQWFCIVKMVDRIRTSTRALELKLKEKSHMGQFRSRRLSLVLEDIKKKERAEVKDEQIKETENFSSICL